MYWGKYENHHTSRFTLVSIQSYYIVVIVTIMTTIVSTYSFPCTKIYEKDTVDFPLSADTGD